LLNSGKKIALVSDAGTPLICDPGSILLEELRKNNISTTSLTGSCAVSTFLSQVPRDTEEYSFVGFLPKSEKQIQELYDKYKYCNMVFYDSPNRLVKTLELIKEVAPEIKVAVGRELTKMFEEIVIDKIDNVINHFKDEVKGEIVAMTFAQTQSEVSKIKDKVEILKQKGFKSKEIAEILSSLYNFNKNDIKQLLY